MLIAVEGCLGVGKSTVARGLAAYRGSALLLEDFESNPFLRDFYLDPKGTAMETEFAFLLVHFHQLKANAGAIGGGEVVSDFHLGKDVVYADLNLSEPRERGVFGDLYSICADRTPAPDLLIMLSASTELLIDRIRGRNRDFEQEIDVDYYASLNLAYEKFFPRYAGKKIVIPMNEWDFVESPALLERLSKMVDSELSHSA